MPNLTKIPSRSVWLAVECLPLLVWRSWRDVGSLRLRRSWTVLVPMLGVALNLMKFSGWPPGPHPWAHTVDILWYTLMIAANEEVILRGYTFHNHPQSTPG